MSKRMRDDDDSEEEEDQELKEVVVHTNLDTHMFFFVPPSLTCSLLEERIVMQHFKFFPDFGKINIIAFKVKGKDGIYCHSSLPKNMQLRNALQMLEDWYFFADVAKVVNNNSNYKKRKHKCPNNDDQELADSRQEVLKLLKSEKTADQSQMCTENIPEVSAQPVLTNVAEETKVDKPKASKRKTKIRKQSERTSEVVAHIINDNVEPAGSKKPEEDNERSSVISKKTSKSKEMPPTKDAPVTAQSGEGEHDNLNEISAQIVSADETDMRNLEKKLKKNSNRKKVDQLSNDDTSSQLKPLEKDYQGSDHEEAQQLKAIDVQDNHCDVSEENLNEKSKMKPQTKHSVSENNIPVKKQPLAVTQRIVTDDNMRENETNDEVIPSKLCNDKLNDIVAHPVSTTVTEANKQKTKKNEDNDIISQAVAESMTDYSEEVIQPSYSSKPLENNEDVSINPVIDLPEIPLTNKNQKEQVDLENEQLDEISVQKASSVEGNTRNLEKQMTSKSKRKNVNQPTTSVDTSSNVMSMKNASEIERNSVEEVMTDYPEEVIQPSNSSKPLENNEDVNINLNKKPKRTQIKPVDDGLMTNKNPKEQGNLKNEQLNEISVQKVSSVKANTEKLEKQTTIKSKRKKVVVQPTTSVDTSSNVMSMKTASEIERNSVEGHQVQVDDDLMTKNQNEQGNLENEQLNEISVQKVSSDKAITQNLEKKTTSKKRKKVDQPTTSVDTSSNVMSMKNASDTERDSVEGRQLQNDAHKANEVDGTEKHKKKHLKKHSGSEKNVSNIPMNQQLATTLKTVEQADDVMPNNNVSDASNQEESSNSTEIENVDNQPASKLKVKKPNPSSSVDTSSKANNSENQQEVSLQEEPPTGSTIAKKLKNPPARKLKAKKLDMSSKSIVNEAQNDKEVSLHDNQPASKVKGKKINLSSSKSQDSERNVGVGNELQNVVQEIDLSQNVSKTAELNQIGQHEEHLDGQREVKMLMQKKLTFSANGPSELEEPNSEPTEILSQEVPSTEIAKSGKWPPSQRVKNLEPKKQNLEVTRKKSKNENSSLERSPLQQCTIVKEPKKSHVENNKDVHKKSDQGHVFKTPSNKSRVEPLSALPEKKRATATTGGLFDDLSSDSSDDEVERNGSSSSTRTPDDLSSSDSSEGESKRNVVESQASQGGGSAKDKANTDLSDLKSLSLESVIRSSRRYKEAKLAASQSQLEDREPPEFFLTVLD